VSSAGSKQVCSEQISFLLKGGCTTQLPSIVLSNLDSDLPLYLWWQEEFREPIDPQLWTWVDRVIYDSHGWSDFHSQIRLLELMQEEANQRIVPCDLNWTRLDNFASRSRNSSTPRFASSPRQDQQGADRFCTRVQINRCLFVGWLGAQLNWHVDEVKSSRDAVQRSVSATHRRRPARAQRPTDHAVALTSVTWNSRHVRELRRSSGGVTLTDRRRARAAIAPAGKNDPVSLMSEELMRGGPLMFTCMPFIVFAICSRRGN